MLTRSQATLFRRWTLGQPEDHGQAPWPEEGTRAAGAAAPHLERIAALVALDGTMPAFQREVNGALAAGASVDDVIGVLRCVTSIVGSARAMAAAPRIALALGYDVEAELELLTPFEDD
jgi:hypothetical protein